MLLKGNNFTAAPQGQFRAVCVDFVDLGEVKTTWKGEERLTHKCQVKFEIEELMEDGKPFLVTSMFTASLGQKANLRKFLEQWRGRPFTKEELAGFETEALVGAQAVVQLVHNERDGNVYANINSIMKLMRGMEPLKPHGTYVRVKDRPVTTTTETPNGKTSGKAATGRVAVMANNAPEDDEPPEWEDEIPF